MNQDHGVGDTASGDLCTAALALPLTGSVTSEKLLNLSVLHYLINEMDGNHPTTRVVT